MSVGTYQDLVTVPELHIEAMADVVHELVAGGSHRLSDGAWLRERVEALGLGPSEAGALESLRVRLLSGGAQLLGTAADLRWG